MTMRCQSLIYGPAERHASGSARVCESGHDSAHWKIIKQTIKDGRRPPPNDLWQLIIYEMEPQSSKKRLAQSYTTAKTENAMQRGTVATLYIAVFLVLIYHRKKAKQKWHRVSHQSKITKWPKEKYEKLCNKLSLK